MSWFKRKWRALMFGLAPFRRRLFLWPLRKKYKNRNVSILSNDCTGGVIYHALGSRFDSPTINLFFEDEDFLRLCLSFEEYIRAPLIEDIELSSSCGYPVGRLLGPVPILIYFMHYASFACAASSWERRKIRINREKLCVIMNWTNLPRIAPEMITAFQKIPFCKICLTRNPVPGISADENVVIDFGEGPFKVAKILSYEKSGRLYLDQFDYAGFLNSL